MTKLLGRVSGFSPLPCPGTPAASPQRRLPCRDELLTGPKTACLILCQARHGAAGMLAASWPTLHITGLNPFRPPLFLLLSLHPVFLVPQDCYAKLSKQRLWECFQVQMYPDHICIVFHCSEKRSSRLRAGIREEAEQPGVQTIWNQMVNAEAADPPLCLRWGFWLCSL